MSDVFEFEDKAKVDRLIGTLHDPAATPGDVLTVQPDGSVAAAPGGGSQPFKWVVVPISFDMPELAVQSFAIIEADAVINTFSISGDHAARFPMSKQFSVSGSTGNDGDYGNGGASYDAGTNTTVIYVGSVPDATADGDIEVCQSFVTLYDPVEGDYWIDGWIEVTTLWDGASPQADLSTMNPADPGPTYEGVYLSVASAQNMDAADGATTSGGSGMNHTNPTYNTVSQTWSHLGRLFPSRPDVGFPIVMGLSQDATPLGLPPRSTQGDGRVILWIGSPA